MNHGAEWNPTPLNEQAPTPGSLRIVEQRLEGALTINLSTMADTTGKASMQDKDRANKVFNCILWQQNMIQSLRNEKVYEGVSAGTAWSDAKEEGARLSAGEALSRLEDWMQQNLSDPSQSEEPNDAIYRGYAEDLQSKLIDEAARV